MVKKEKIAEKKVEASIGGLQDFNGNIEKTSEEVPKEDNLELNNTEEKQEKETKPVIFDVSKIKEAIETKLKTGFSPNLESQINEQRGILEEIPDLRGKKKSKNYLLTGIPGFDELLDQGIPNGSSILVAGGAGSGKTIFCLQTAVNHALQGKKCMYMSFEEKPERLISHMNDFGFEVEKAMKKGFLKIERFSPFDITRSVDALMAKQKGELLIDIDPVIISKNFKPELIFLDSLTAIASAFTGKEDSYRIYIEQLFRFFEKIGATSFLITETEQIPKIFSTTGVEEFLADGVIVLYNIKRGDVRENAIEVLKLRGTSHKKKIVAFNITDNGIVVYPQQEVFGGLGE